MNTLMQVDMPLYIILKWVVLLLMFAGMWVWLAVENRAAKALLHDGTPSHPGLKLLVYQTRLRSTLFLVLLFMFCVTVATYDIKIERLSSAPKETVEQNIPLFAQPLQEIPESESPTPPIPITVTESIFTPSSSEPSTDMEYTSKLDELKVRYEELLVTYLYLSSCKQTTEADYHTIIRSLDQEMQGLEASPDLRENIVSAARGSYQEIYSGSGCDSATLQPVISGFQAFITQTAALQAEKTAKNQ